MQNHRFCVLLLILLLCLHGKAQQQGGSVLERRVSINANNQSLTSILDQISWQAKVFFSYDASQIDGNKTYTLNAIDKSLFSVLNNLFPSQKYKITELENQIIISSKNETKSSNLLAGSDTIPVKYFFLSGKIIDGQKNEPVSFASVSVYKKPVGTITNTNGDFLLKLHPDYIRDTVVLSCMGYAQIKIPGYQLLDLDVIAMTPVSIRIREVKVTSITPEKLLDNIRDNIKSNYTAQTKLMTAFYRETVKQDKNYIDASEAVLEILKSPYVNTTRTDLVKLIKGRQSPDMKPFSWVNFKLQGGPFTITKLDVVKTIETFIDKDFQDLYRYNIRKVIWYNEYPVYVVEFQPTSNSFFPGYVGELYVHRETFAILHAKFRLNKNGLKKAENILIKKKSRGIKAKPSFVEYAVDYQLYQGKWHLKTARASVKFKIKSKKDKINSVFQSISDLLITNIEPTEIKKFPKRETFTHHDIFIEMINDYDSGFWENYNIIKPDEDLQKAIKNFTDNN